MCLRVKEICDPKQQGVEVSKMLYARNRGLQTPFTGMLVPFGDGFFEPRLSFDGKELRRLSSVYEGYLHAAKAGHLSYCTSNVIKTPADMFIRGALIPGNSVELWGTAYDVAAYEDDDLVCGRLYLPQLDVRNYSPWELALLKRKLPRSFTEHTKEVMGILGLGPIPSKPQPPKTPRVETDYSLAA